MNISSDTKDWTWVTARVCEQCGFDPNQITLGQLPGEIRNQVQSWADVLSRPNVLERPQPDKWSSLEYGAHVRDVLIVMRGRLKRMLAQENPDLPSWDQDQAALDGKYRALNPAILVDEIGIEAQMLANHYASVTDAQARRTGQRTDGLEFTVLSHGKYLLHELVHHGWDVRADTAIVGQGQGQGQGD